jgi:hypothetical protein
VLVFFLCSNFLVFLNKNYLRNGDAGVDKSLKKLIGEFPVWLKEFNKSLQPHIDSGFNKAGLIGVISIRFYSFLHFHCFLFGPFASIFFLLNIISQFRFNKTSTPKSARRIAPKLSRIKGSARVLIFSRYWRRGTLTFPPPIIM